MHNSARGKRYGLTKVERSGPPFFIKEPRLLRLFALAGDSQDSPVAQAREKEGVGAKELRGAKGVAAVKDDIFEPIERVWRDQSRHMVGRREFASQTDLGLRPRDGQIGQKLGDERVGTRVAEEDEMMILNVVGSDRHVVLDRQVTAKKFAPLGGKAI